MFIAYNLKRIMNIIGIDKLQEYLSLLITAVYWLISTKLSHKQL